MLSEGNAAHPVKCDSPLQIVMAVWCTFFTFEEGQAAITVFSRLSCPTQQVQVQKSAPNGPYYLQRAITLDWMGSIAL